MCNRESFVLLPLESGIPVAWSTSYHHEIIGKHLRRMISCPYTSTGQFPTIQIECIGGNIIKWDWDNTPMIKRFVPKNIPSMWKPITEDISASVIDIDIELAPDLPRWLEDNLHTYENKVESILERLNPVRDMQENLVFFISRRFPITNAGNSLDLEDVMPYVIPDSPEVREFERIINAYRTIPGFVHSLYNPRREPKYEYQKWR